MRGAVQQFSGRAGALAAGFVLAVNIGVVAAAGPRGTLADLPTFKDFKAALSSADEAVLDIPEIDVEIRLTRRDFEALIGDLLQQFEQGVDETLAKSDMKADSIDLVLRTGGSSLIPAVRRILEERFPGRVVEHDPFTSVAAGLAIADFRGYRYG